MIGRVRLEAAGGYEERDVAAEVVVRVIVTGHDPAPERRHSAGFGHGEGQHVELNAFLYDYRDWIPGFRRKIVCCRGELWEGIRVST
jgi:hypothetical protein